MSKNAYLLYYESKGKPPNDNFVFSQTVHIENIGQLIYQLRECEKQKIENVIINTIPNAKPLTL